MTTEQKIEAFEGWCIVELMGHNVIAGFCSEQMIAGTAMLRVDVPNADGDDPFACAFTKYFASSAIYGLTPTTAEAAMLAASRIRARPVSLYILPETTSPRLAGLDEYDAHDAGDFDEYDDNDDQEDDDGAEIESGGRGHGF